VVEGDGLENRSAKAPGVRIPPPPPSDAEMGDARRKLEALLDRHGFCCLPWLQLPPMAAHPAIYGYDCRDVIAA
jgi:hypothetical protein